MLAFITCLLLSNVGFSHILGSLTYWLVSNPLVATLTCIDRPIDAARVHAGVGVRPLLATILALCMCTCVCGVSLLGIWWPDLSSAGEVARISSMYIHVYGIYIHIYIYIYKCTYIY